jgi:hypothetical protein
MSAELCLQRFDPPSDDGPKRPGIVAELAALARRVLAAEGRRNGVEVVDGKMVRIDWDGSTIELHATHGLFPITALDKVGIQLAFQIAKEGDMVIVIEGGKYRAILTDLRQWDALPAGWIKNRAHAPVCRSAAELEALLGDWFSIHGRYAEQMQRELEKRTDEVQAGPIPGTQPDKQREFIYIEARPSETALKHLRVVSKLYREAVKAGVHTFPQSGLMGTTSWRLELPTGVAFYALFAGGDKEAWLSALRACVSLAGRAVGRIVNGDKFVLDDGQSFPLAACTCAKVKE